MKYTNLKILLSPYKAQFDRSPRHIKIISMLCVIWLSTPIDLFDILFPWAAFTDDLFIAGLLLKMLYKHGGLPEDKVITPLELLKNLFGKDKDHRRTVMTYEELAISAKIFLEQVSKRKQNWSYSNMKMYWFERDLQTNESLERRVNEMKKAGMDGVMYPFGSSMGDYFTKISRIIDVKSKFKFIIAIRPYTISAQYLSMICSSINSISPNVLAVNLLTGYVNKHEQAYGGILSEPNDSSPSIVRSNFMLEYAKEFKKISKNEFFVSTTNDTVFENCAKNEFAMIVPYVWYKANRFDLEDQKVVISIAPVLKENKADHHYECDNNNECRHPAESTCMDLDFFTTEEFFEFLDDAERRGITGMLFQEADYIAQEYDNILPAITEYKRRKSEVEK